MPPRSPRLLALCLLALGLTPAIGEAQTKTYALITPATPALPVTPGSFFEVTTPALTTPLIGLPLSNAIAASPDGAFWAIAGLDDVVYRVSVKDRSVTTLGVPLGSGSTLAGIAVAPNGKFVVVTQNGAAPRVVVVNADTGAVLIDYAAPIGFDLGDILFPHESSRIYIASPVGQALLMLNLSTGSFEAPVVLPTGSTPVALAATGSRFIYAAVNGSTTGRIFRWDTVMGSMSNPAISPATDPISGIAVALDGTVYITMSSGYVRPYNPSAETFGATTVTGVSPTRVGVTPNGSRLFLGQGVLGGLTWAYDLPGLTMGGATPSTSTGTLGTFITPIILEQMDLGLPGLSATSNSDLNNQGFRQFVVFNNGRLDAGGDIYADRSLRLLGTAKITLNGHEVEFTRDVYGAQTLAVAGPGSFRIGGQNEQAGTVVTDGAIFQADKAHPGVVSLLNSTGYLGGDVGILAATGSTVRAGTKNSAGSVTATSAIIGAGSTLESRVFIDSDGIMTCDKLASVGSMGVAPDAQLVLSPQSANAAVPGSSCVLAQNVNGLFAGKPEGTQVPLGGQTFTLSYVGGNLTLTLPAIVNLPPTLTGFSNQTIRDGEPAPPTFVTLGDDTTPVNDLTLTATSSNQTLLPDANLVVTGTGSSRTIQASPVAGRNGVTTITLVASDGTDTTTRTYTLTVDENPAITYNLAEGATGGFFNTDLVLVNPHATATPVRVEVTGASGQVVARDVTLDPLARYTLHIADLTELRDATFSTQVVSPTGRRVAVERTMWWDATGYGSHTERASEGATRRHYFAEGAQGFFKTYFLLQNPTNTANVARLTFLLEGGGTLLREYEMPTAGRLTVDAADIAELRDQAFSTSISFEQPGFAERSMYFGAEPAFAGGSGAAGVSKPSQEWYLAEGATGSFFSTYLLAMNPGTEPAEVSFSYLRESGGIIATKTHTIPGESRLTIDPVNEAPELAATTFATRIASSQGIVVERSMYWPKAAWTESHASTASAWPDYEWALAEGRVGGTQAWQTFVLLANMNERPATVRLRFVRDPREHGGQPQEPIIKTVTVPAAGRLTVAVAGAGSDVPELVDETFGVVIDADWPIVVERSMYASPNGATWSSGTNAPGTNLFGRGPG